MLDCGTTQCIPSENSCSRNLRENKLWVAVMQMHHHPSFDLTWAQSGASSSDKNMYLAVHLGQFLPFTGLMESLEFSLHFITASPPSLTNDLVFAKRNPLRCEGCGNLNAATGLFRVWQQKITFDFAWSSKRGEVGAEIPQRIPSFAFQQKWLIRAPADDMPVGTMGNEPVLL